MHECIQSIYEIYLMAPPASLNPSKLLDQLVPFLLRVSIATTQDHSRP